MPHLQQILETNWRHKEFRPLQREIIESVMAGADTVALLPTGGGKSITYQLPALALPGIAVVITPLIALMKDQVDALRKRHINAVAVHSALQPHEVDRLLDNCVYGGVKILYIAPERIDTPMFRSRLRKMEVSLVAVDEAHCISEWGYDFRPSYLRIKELRDQLPGVPFLALTATATRQVLDDICGQLRLNEPRVFRAGFARPNLRFVLREGENKLDQLLRVVRGVEGSGIVYVRTRRAAEEVAAQLMQEGISADFYHAGLGHRLRNAKQEDWTRGRLRIIVATNAFGMGIDKSDVRFVVHHQMPASLEAYYQEAGRAGRDGLPAYAVLLYQGADVAAAERRIALEYPPLDTIRQVYEALFNYLQVPVGEGKNQLFDFDLMAFATRFKFFSLTAYNALKILELNGYLTLTDLMENPTRIQFRISREELYKLQVDRTDLEGFIKGVLRMYTGLFTDLVPIDEGEIARRSGYTEERVVQMLYRLSVMRVIRYIPRRNSPLVVLEQERLPTADLTILPQTYDRRRELSQLRAAAMVEYAENRTQCRSVVIGHYFDEADPEPCGVCDVCLERKTTPTAAEHRLHAVEERVLERLNSLEAGETIALRQLVAAIPGSSMRVLTAIRRLVAEGKVLSGAGGGFRRT